MRQLDALLAHLPRQPGVQVGGRQRLPQPRSDVGGSEERDAVVGPEPMRRLEGLERGELVGAVEVVGRETLESILLLLETAPPCPSLAQSFIPHLGRREDEIYVIGGLIDRRRPLNGASLARAQARNRLTIERHRRV